MPLRVINGGGGNPPPQGKFRKHPFADFLWKAIYPHYAASLEQIADRMSKARGKRVSQAQASAAIRHIRDNQYKYNWTISHVQKGNGDQRRYFPVLVDGEDKTYTVTELDCIKAGTISSLRTIATMSAHQATTLEILIESGASGLDRSARRLLRSATSALDTGARMAEEAIAKFG
jgi:hypothetical protein